MKRSELKIAALDSLNRRGVILEEIAELVMILQKSYHPELTIEECVEHLEKVLENREVAHAVITGVAIDELADKKLLPEPLQSIVEVDDGLYGIDEVLPLSITNVYGSIGLTNFGFLDKEKIGKIKELNEEKDVQVNTFLDDLVAALASAAASRIAHSKE